MIEVLAATVLAVLPGAAAPAGTSAARAASVSTPLCAADLRPEFDGLNGASMHLFVELHLRNVGRAACHTRGWPGVELRDRRGRPFVQARRVRRDYGGSFRVRRVVLAPGQAAGFRLVTHSAPEGPHGIERCHVARSLRITPPDTRRTRRLAIPGVAACGRTVTVSPLVAEHRPGRCRTARLRITHGKSQGALGNGFEPFLVRNIGPRCRTRGWPGVELRAPDGAPVQASRVRGDYFGNVPIRTIVLRPGGVASFRLHTRHGSVSARRCPTTASVRVTPPDERQARIVRARIYFCDRKVTVTPLVAGRTAR